MKAPITILLILICAFSVSAQSEKKTTVRPKVKFSNLTNEGKGCLRISFSGTVAKRMISDDEITLNGFILREANDNRIYINVDSDFLSKKGRFSLSDVAFALSLDRRVKITVFGCGAAGAFYWLNRLTAY